VVLKGASKPILPDDTHNEPKMSFSFFQVPHTPQQQQQSNVEDCHRLTEMFSLNFPFRNIFCFLVSAMRSSRRRISFSFFHRSLKR
jgi:hypothetical protein